MKIDPIFAPRADYLIHMMQSRTVNEILPLTPKIDKLIGEFKKVKVQGEDGFRRLYIEAHRGEINDFGSYEEHVEEGIFDSYDDFVELWECYYPDVVKWYELSFSEYKDVCYLTIDGRMIIQTNVNDFQKTNNPIADELCDWLYDRVHDAVERLATNSDRYYSYIEKNLAFQKRFGRIIRRDYWSINKDEEKYFRSDFSTEDIKRFKIISEMANLKKRRNRLKRMNAEDFFNYCKFCYEANGYFVNAEKPMNAKEMYLAMADGRDCGLRNISPGSDEEFLEWHINDSHCGGHPWEICRGGNATHISLYVHHEENEWMLVLAGSSSIRAVETIKMALALHKNEIPFNLNDADELYRMVTGQDYIGIVPEHITPRYCHSSFPDEDRIVDFLNLQKAEEQEIIKKAHWYPLIRPELRKGAASHEN